MATEIEGDESRIGTHIDVFRQASAKTRLFSQQTSQRSQKPLQVPFLDVGLHPAKGQSTKTRSNSAAPYSPLSHLQLAIPHMSSHKLQSMEARQVFIDAKIADLTMRVAQAQVEVSSNSSSDSSVLLAQYEDKVRPPTLFLLSESSTPQEDHMTPP